MSERQKYFFYSRRDGANAPRCTNVDEKTGEVCGSQDTTRMGAYGDHIQYRRCNTCGKRFHVVGKKIDESAQVS